MPRAWNFDFYSSLPFWGALVLTALVVRLAGARPRLRGLVLLAASSAMLLAIPRFRPGNLALLWAVAVLALLVARGLAARPPAVRPRLRAALSGAGIVAILGVLFFFKYRFFRDLLVRPLQGAEPLNLLVPLGVSYFTFRAIHVVVESYRGKFETIPPLAFLNYMTFFPAFISGPINRFGEFSADMAAARPGTLRADLAQGAERIVHGLFKKFVLVPIVLPHILGRQPGGLAGATPLSTVLGLYAYALYFYFDFSGYTDLAIGTARVLGVGLPENFDAPFLRRNIRELWSSWHISLTNWLVDYVYWPVVKWLRNLEFFRPRPLLLSIIGMNVTFLACGLWHGDTLSFVLWGAYHGMGISVLQIYQRQAKRIRRPWFQQYLRSRTSRVVGAVATFNFFAAGLVLFVLDTDQLRTLFHALTGTVR